MAVFRETVPRTFQEKLFELNWSIVLLLLLLGTVGVAMLYSAAEGQWNPWASRHLARFSVGVAVMLAVALFPPRFWMGMAYPIYFGALALLVGVEVLGVTINGAQRWLDLGPVRMQPSEIMKIAQVLALARFYHDLPPDKINSPYGLLVPALLIGAPVALILNQPDLGTAVLVAVTGGAIVFLAGLSWRIIIGGIIAAAIAIPAFLRFGLEDYQRQRILTFLNPEADPQGAGYHIIQSKIALGSGGLTGRGFVQGTQTQLNFLPEKQTDFIFTILGEEFGLIGALAVLALYALVLANAVAIAASCKSVFLRLTVMGIVTTLALYIFINVGMVTGMLPVVGVPLPLISYGGTVMMAVLFGFGLILGAHIHRNADPPRGAGLFG
jgi:rod shape determining protein RodA